MGGIQVGWGVFIATEGNILSFYRQLKKSKDL